MLKCIAIRSDGSIFATLAFYKNSVLVATGYRGFQIHPTATEALHRSCRSSALLRQGQELGGLQFGGELLALHREFTEEFLAFDSVCDQSSSKKSVKLITAPPLWVQWIA
jgi:hypothetical protein